MLQNTKKIVCPNQFVKYPITELEPILWLISDNTRYSVFNIDYIVTNNKKISAFFQKFEYESNDYEVNLEDIFNVCPKQSIIGIAKLSKLLNCDYKLFLWPVDYLKTYDDNVLQQQKIFEITIVLNNDNIEVESTKKISVNELERLIYNYRGMDFKNGKPLSTGTSYVGCYLSNNTKNPWPGDLDAIIFDNVNNCVSALIEFKTHNIDSPTTDERIDKYSQADWRRFDVLFSLQNQLELLTKNKPKLIYIPWGTKNYSNHNLIKLDLLENSKAVKTITIQRPNFGTFSSDLFNNIMRL